MRLLRKPLHFVWVSVTIISVALSLVFPKFLPFTQEFQLYKSVLWPGNLKYVVFNPLYRTRNFTLLHETCHVKIFFFSPVRQDQPWGPQNLLSKSYRSLTWRSEADLPPPRSGEIINVWNWISKPHCVLVAWCLIKHRGVFVFAVNFTFEAFYILPFSEGKGCMLRNRVLDSARYQYFILR